MASGFNSLVWSSMDLFIRVDNAENFHVYGRNEPRSVHQRPLTEGWHGCAMRRTGAPSSAPRRGSARHRRDPVQDHRLRLALAVRQPRRTVSIGRRPRTIPEIVFESLNRTGIEDSLANETGWFTMSDLRGDVMSLISPAPSSLRSSGPSRGRNAGLEGPRGFQRRRLPRHRLRRAGATEDLPYLNTSGSAYTVPTYPTGLGSPGRPS